MTLGYPTRGTQIKARLGVQGKIYNVQVSMGEKCGWATLQSCASLQRALSVMFELKRGAYHFESIAKALAEQSRTGRAISAEELPFAILQELENSPVTGVTVPELAEVFAWPDSRVAQAVKILLEENRIDRTVMNGIAMYSKQGTKPRAENFNRLIVELLRKHKKLGPLKLFEHMGVHIPADANDRLKKLVALGVLKQTTNSKQTTYSMGHR